MWSVRYSKSPVFNIAKVVTTLAVPRPILPFFLSPFKKAKPVSISEWSRPTDLLYVKEMLYQLSYRNIYCAIGGNRSHD